VGEPDPLLREGLASPLRLQGHLVLEEWNSKEGGEKRSKMVIYVDEIEFLGSRGDNAAGAGPAEAAEPAGKASSSSSDGIEEVPF